MKKYYLLFFILIIKNSSLQSQTLSDSTFLDILQKKSFEFFWNEANPLNGLIKDRSATYAPCSIASVGFGLTSICVAVDHDWITREAARDRVLTTLKTFWYGSQNSGATNVMGYKGFFYHFLNMQTENREWSSELSTIDSGLLFAGIIYVQEYFDQNNQKEKDIRAFADSIYRRADWDWFMNLSPTLKMEWKPERGFGTSSWYGYNEAMIMYILALGSPTKSITNRFDWSTWTKTYIWNDQYSMVQFPPLFGHQYSHCWIDYRKVNDSYMSQHGTNYFLNSRRATLANREYCIQNPKGHAGYGPFVWGLTASDYPGGYIARGAPPAENDEGTVAPTAAGGSIPFAPEVCIPTLRYMYDQYNYSLWGKYGFKDAFNIGKNWWATDYIGIDQGPIVIMIENYLNEKVWNTFMKSAYIQEGLKRAGFFKTTDIKNDEVVPKIFDVKQNYPNPFNSSTNIDFVLPESGNVKIEIYNSVGQKFETLVNSEMKSGNHSIKYNSKNLVSGIYFYKITFNNSTYLKTMHLIK